MRHMEPVDIADALAAQVEHFAVRQRARQARCEIVERNHAGRPAMDEARAGRGWIQSCIEPHSSASTWWSKPIHFRLLSGTMSAMALETAPNNALMPV